jgi:hypothetical protein
MSCTQYISFLLLTFSSLLRNAPNSGCMRLQDGDPLAPLLLPAAQLAADALRIYAGPDGALIRASNTYLRGHEASFLATFSTANHRMTPALMQQAMQQLTQQAGSIACSMVISNALRVADTFSILAYNSCIFFLGPLAAEYIGAGGSRGAVVH